MRVHHATGPWPDRPRRRRARGCVLARRPSGVPALVLGREEIEQRGNFFLDLDHELCLAELGAQLVALAGELGDLQRVDARGVDLGAALLPRERSQVGDLELTSPAQVSGFIQSTANPNGQTAGFEWKPKKYQFRPLDSRGSPCSRVSHHS